MIQIDQCTINSAVTVQVKKGAVEKHINGRRRCHLAHRGGGVAAGEQL